MNKEVNCFSRIIATMLIFTVSFMFFSCPVDPIPKETQKEGPSPLTPGVGTPCYFFLDSDGNCIETEDDGPGRTGLIVEDNQFAEGVLVYSDDTGKEDRVAFVNEDNVVSMFFKKDSEFPHRMTITSGSDTYYAYVSPYDTENSTYNITFLNNGRYEMVDHVVLNKDIFSLYEDDSELSNSQNRRMANMIVAMGVWGSLYSTFDSQLNGYPHIVFNRSIWGNISRGVAKVFTTVAIAAVVVAVVVAPIVSLISPVGGLVIASFAVGVVIISTDIAIVATLIATLFDYLEDETQPPTAQVPTVLVTLPYENNRNIKYNSDGNHEEFHIPLGKDLLVKFYLTGTDFSGITTTALSNGFMFIDEPGMSKGTNVNSILFQSITVEEASSSGVLVVKFKRSGVTGFIGDGKVNFGFVFNDTDGNPIDLIINDGYMDGFDFRLPPDFELKRYKNIVVIHFCMDTP